MGNTRSSARRSASAFLMGEDSATETYAEPLLSAQEKAEGADVESERESVGLDSAIHQLNSFFALLWPVCITMVLASLVVCFADDKQLERAMMSYMYYKNVDASAKSVGEKSALALLNGLVLIGFIAALTVAIVLLYKFNCIKFFFGYCIFYAASLLALAGTKLVVVVLGDKLGLVFDCGSHWFVMYNFAVVGVLSIFYQKGIPRVVEQGYLVAISVIVAWQLAQLPEWSVWMLLLLLGFWDLFAVLAPCGPLRWLVDLVHEKGTPLPGLLFQAEITDAHASASSAVGDQRSERTRARMVEKEFIESLFASPLPAHGDAVALTRHERGFHHQIAEFLHDQQSMFQHRAPELSRAYERHQLRLWRQLYAYYDVRRVPSSKPYPPIQQVLSSDNNTADASADNSIRLGLGDFIFYSVLVARAALQSFAAFVACFLCVLAGLAATMFLLARFDALPALPISVFSGVLAFLLSMELLVPFLSHLTAFSILAV